MAMNLYSIEHLRHHRWRFVPPWDDDSDDDDDEDDEDEDNDGDSIDSVKSPSPSLPQGKQKKVSWKRARKSTKPNRRGATEASVAIFDEDPNRPFTESEDALIIMTWIQYQGIIQKCEPVNFWKNELSQFSSRTAKDIETRARSLCLVIEHRQDGWSPAFPRHASTRDALFARLVREPPSSPIIVQVELPHGEGGQPPPPASQPLEPEAPSVSGMTSSTGLPTTVRPPVEEVTTPMPAPTPTPGPGLAPGSSTAAVPAPAPKTSPSPSGLEESSKCLARFDSLLRGIIKSQQQPANLNSALVFIHKVVDHNADHEQAWKYINELAENDELFSSILSRRIMRHPLIGYSYEDGDVDELLLWSINKDGLSAATVLGDFEASLKDFASHQAARGRPPFDWGMLYWGHRDVIQDIRTRREAISSDIKSKEQSQ